MSVQAPQTTFIWPARRKSSWRLAGLIFAMLFLHSATFFLFQAATPVINPPPRTAPPVQMLSATGHDGTSLPENESLLRWIDAEDPALVARIPNVDLQTHVEVPFRPSFATMRTPPLSLPAEVPTVQFPPARDALSLIMSGMPSRETAQTPLPPCATEVLFPGRLGERVLQPPTFKPRARVAQLLQTSHFVMGISPEGETRFVFPQTEETGSVAALDKEAAAFLATVRFKPEPGTPMVWATAQVRWGDDIVAGE
jgi:hypothetical protein